MGKEVNQLIAQILNINDYSSDDTKVFKKVKHNNDLVPRFKKNFEELAKLINPYYNDCYDIQGVTDDGVDVLLKYQTDLDYHKIGFQIKSYDDIKNKDWLKTLKAQLFEAQGIWKTEDLYIVFCTDSIEHKDKLRNAISEIQKSSDCQIHIVEPEKALTFYNFTSIDIFSIIYDFYHSNDSSKEKAKKCIERLDVEEKEFLINLIVHQFINHEEPISLEEFSIPDNMDNFSFYGSQFYNYNSDSNSISYSYENNWDLTNFVVETQTKFDFTDSQLKAFLYKCLIV